MCDCQCVLSTITQGTAVLFAAALGLAPAQDLQPPAPKTRTSSAQPRVMGSPPPGSEGPQASSAGIFHHPTSFLDGRLLKVYFWKCHTQQPPCPFVPWPSLGELWSPSWKAEGRLAPTGKTHGGACWRRRDIPSWSCDCRPAGPSGRLLKGSDRVRSKRSFISDNFVSRYVWLYRFLGLKSTRKM